MVSIFLNKGTYNVLVLHGNKSIFVKGLFYDALLHNVAPSKYYSGNDGTLFMYDLQHPGMQRLEQWLEGLPRAWKVESIV